MSIEKIRVEFEKWSGFTISDSDCKTEDSLNRRIDYIADQLSDEVYQTAKGMRSDVRQLKLPEEVE